MKERWSTGMRRALQEWRAANPDNWPTDRVVFPRPHGLNGIRLGFQSTTDQFWVLVSLEYDDATKRMTVVRDRRGQIGRMPPGQPPRPSRDERLAKEYARKAAIKEEMRADAKRLGVTMRGIKQMKREGLV